MSTLFFWSIWNFGGGSSQHDKQKQMVKYVLIKQKDRDKMYLES